MRALLILAALSLHAETVLDGVYTDDQADEGKTVFLEACSRCHGVNLRARSDSPLEGDGFMYKFGEENLDALYSVIRLKMPAGAPGSLSDREYLAIVSYILRANQFPAGEKALTAAALKDVLLVDKDPSRPLPTNSVVRVIGCLVGGQLTHATDPLRAARADEISAPEIKVAAGKPLGSQTFRLTNPVGVRPGIVPKEFDGHRVLTKGVLIRDGETPRINVTSMESIGRSETCPTAGGSLLR